MLELFPTASLKRFSIGTIIFNVTAMSTLLSRHLSNSLASLSRTSKESLTKKANPGYLLIEDLRNV
jgi:hypothetical protein